jgi:hypothetical protein
MARVPITVMGYRCERCSHEWVPRDFETEPRICPKCKSPYWNRPRRGGPMLSYEAFRDKIRDTIVATGPLTWTEIRTTAKLPQAFPNNQWVRRLEADIGLERTRDAHGIILWTLKNAPTKPPDAPEHRTKTANRKQKPVE